MFKMTPFNERTPDTQYRNILKTILESGEIQSTTWQGVGAKFIFGELSMHFNLQNGAPLINERKISFWPQAIGEIFAFVNGTRSQRELENFGCRWWSQWTTPEKCSSFGLSAGDLGPGSYGAAFHDFPTGNGNFNQFEYLIAQMKKYPFGSPDVSQYSPAPLWYEFCIHPEAASSSLSSSLADFEYSFCP